MNHPVDKIVICGLCHHHVASCAVSHNHRQLYLSVDSCDILLQEHFSGIQIHQQEHLQDDQYVFGVLQRSWTAFDFAILS